MKILMITNEYFELVGGLQTYINNLKEGLQRRGITVFHLHISNQISNVSNSSYFSIKKPISGSLFNVSFYSQIRRYILQINPDVIHNHCIHHSPLSLLLATKGYKQIQTIHDTMYLNAGPFTWQDRSIVVLPLVFFLEIIHKIFKKLFTDVFICPSLYLLKICRKYGFKNSIYLPHFTPSFKKLKRTRSSESGQKSSTTVLFVGRLVTVKGIFDLLDAFELAFQQNKTLRLLYVGTGPDKDKLQQKIQEKKLKSFVSLVGEIQHDQLSPFYSDALVVVIPTLRNEAFGLVAIEAMSQGKVIIAYKGGALAELVVDGKTGFVIKKGNIPVLGQKLLYVATHKKAMSKLGRDGQQIAQIRYSESSHLNTLIYLYESALKDKNLK